MTCLPDLDPQTRRVVERAALEEIALFGASGDPDAIERLAEAGRAIGVEEAAAELSAWVSDAQADMAAELRRRQLDMAAAFGAMGGMVRLMVRG